MRTMVAKRQYLVDAQQLMAQLKRLVIKRAARFGRLGN